MTFSVYLFLLLILILSMDAFTAGLSYGMSNVRVPFFSISGSEFVEMFVGMARPRCGICLSRPMKRLPASCSLMRSTPLGPEDMIQTLEVREKFDEQCWNC